jgi:integrase
MRGKGRIYRPANRKVWMLAYYVGPPDARRRIRESAKTENEEVAGKRLETKLRRAKNAEEGISDFEEPTHRRVTVGTLFDELLADYQRREIKSLKLVRLRLAKGKRLRKTFGERRASSLTPADLSRYVIECKAQCCWCDRTKEESHSDHVYRGFANASVNREMELLHRALRLGIESKRIVRMPAFPKKLPEKNARQGFFETGDLLKILPNLREPLDDMARFAFETGWRRGMLLGMKWSHVDRVGGLVTLPDSKNDDPQTMPLDGELLALIERRWKAREYQTPEGVIGVSEYVFHRKGRPIPTTTFNVQFREARQKASVSSGRFFHDFRRTAARNMIRGGVPQSVAMRVTGHRSDSMFRRYDIASVEDKLEALRRAREYAKSRAAVSENVREFPVPSVNATDTRSKKPASSLGNLVAVQGFEPRTQRI